MTFTLTATAAIQPIRYCTRTTIKPLSSSSSSATSTANYTTCVLTFNNKKHRNASTHSNDTSIIIRRQLSTTTSSSSCSVAFNAAHRIPNNDHRILKIRANNQQHAHRRSLHTSRTSSASSSSSSHHQQSKRDYYEVLSVQRDASQSDIKRAYYQLAKKLHPDTNTSVERNVAQAQFAELQNAYECLSDPEKRKMYDMYGHSAEQMGAGAGGFNGFGSAEDILRDFFGGAGMGGGNPFAGFAGAAGGGRDASSMRQTRGADLESTLSLTFMEAIFGTTKQMDLSSMQPCEPCSGTGNKPDTTSSTCKQCQGTGMQFMRQGPFQVQMTCTSCSGMGSTQPRCTSCGGRGVQRQRRTINVTVPAGVDNDTRIRLVNQGDAGQCGGPQGHLFIRLRVEKHPIFTRDEDDNIHVDVDIPLHVAILGGTIDVPTLQGKTQIKVERGSQPYEQRVLRGKGVKSVGRSNHTGNLYVHFKVKLPTDVNDQQSELLKEFCQSVGDMKSETTNKESKASTPKSAPSTQSNETDRINGASDDATKATQSASTATETKKAAATSSSSTSESASESKPKKSAKKKNKSFVESLKSFVVGDSTSDSNSKNSNENEKAKKTAKASS
jgi:molecular chaperone DnaJ